METENASEYQAGTNSDIGYTDAGTDAHADTMAADSDFSSIRGKLQKRSALFILEMKERYRLTG